MNVWIAVEDVCERTRKRWYARRAVGIRKNFNYHIVEEGG